MAMLRDPVAHLDLYLVSRRGTQQTSTALAFAAAMREAAGRLNG